MSESLLETFNPIIPKPEESRAAEESTRRLDGMREKLRKGLSIGIQTEDKEEMVPIPVSLFGPILEILTNMAKGKAVTIVPSHAELTTKEAANVLNVSRPFVIGLIEKKILPHRMVGSHRRIRFDDLMDYKRRIDSDRLKSLEKLAALDQEMGMEE